MTKAERIADLAGQIEDEARTRAIKDIIETLGDFLKDGVKADEKPGMRAAIAIIKANVI
jgi:hypothetical protein